MARAGFNNGGMEEQKGRTFFKIIKPGFNTDHLRIPPAFRKHILNELSIRATLTLSSSADSSWNVRVHKIGRDIYLKEGWQEFLRDNSLGDSEFLVFGYDGNMHFSIDIFEKDCCKRTKAPALRRHQQSTFINNTKRPRGRPRKSGDAAEHTLNGESSNSTKRPRGRPRKSGDAAEHTLNGESRNSTKRPRGRPRKSGDAAEHTPNGESSIPIEHTESRSPAFIRTINKVYGVDLPTGFCRKHLLPPDYYKFILENTEGDRWEVNGVPSNNTIMLSCGWVSFARGNGVEIGDDCLFELKSKSKMVVHIIRQNH
ncbi:B3 domain-containing protein Os11g0197600-like isoform X1 [Rosa rugosa]|uniref:B3 domain-containing protein Os11g0197600-like isoform X1 n=1 Tax=Rosa rugosa TaxID=74645 RepID=UPI002B414EBD|nr:B3 domain-containing protein Os11g0197600-like isoform X1 [Rosa rugosa]XP_062019974.1 B3 domain-containing protein Os11g0197600-like isoform X1 [Rosa rugosa]XP_062019975.1 B3 domain-containing protein Os11g0197600-like isoform X1 [Rosa rugosa]XP_062019976.1 B3 domain-containing protein Os11g0197600-like isoform X1 [Rosa rugosa]XP_062019977.1 B3 domain-containing protein Os11g0197600-like isoform X1 [Rosa rugosa]XP_062019978.1 B3 domain-containing protein Os11g0197600-like isoform X1 [Rosa r